jgi:hypothetical protein
MNIIVSGMIAAHPGQGGATWAVLQYVLGLKALGHDVYFLEQIPDKLIEPNGTPLQQSVNARYFSELVHHFGLDGKAALVCERSHETAGASYSELVQLANRTDLLFNISGTLSIPDLAQPAPVRVYVDLDPAFTQVWHTQGIDMGFSRHTHFVTIGLNIGKKNCPVPACGIQWLRTVQPIVLDYWPVTTQPCEQALTTIGNWRAYGSVVHDGVHYGQKAHSLRPFLPLPKLTTTRFRLAMAIHSGDSRDLSALEQNGWELQDPLEVAQTPDSYQHFIQQSWAEFGIAKSGYVASRCGWFSDRSICYLASGRPVIAQDTGFPEHLPVGEGLLAFQNSDDVLAAVALLRGDYRRHAEAARRIAETCFDSKKVLSSMLDAISVSVAGAAKGFALTEG